MFQISSIEIYKTGKIIQICVHQHKLASFRIYVLYILNILNVVKKQDSEDQSWKYVRIKMTRVGLEPATHRSVPYCAKPLYHRGSRNPDHFIHTNPISRGLETYSGSFYFRRLSELILNMFEHFISFTRIMPLANYNNSCLSKWIISMICEIFRK